MALVRTRNRHLVPNFWLKALSLYVLSRLPVFAFFKDELEARKSLKAFFYSQNYN